MVKEIDSRTFVWERKRGLVVSEMVGDLSRATFGRAVKKKER
jgi:hypothetical protein